MAVTKPTSWDEADADFIPYDDTTLRVKLEELDRIGAGFVKVTDILPSAIVRGGKQIPLPDIFVLDTMNGLYVVRRGGGNYIREIQRIK